MPFTDQTEYPRGVFRTYVLTTSALDVGPKDKKLRVGQINIKGGVANEVIIFRNSAGLTEYFRLPVPAGAHLNIPRGFLAAVESSGFHGLEILTVDAAGDVYVDITYYS